MFSAASLAIAHSPLSAQVRGMATLKDIRLRLKSVKNIQKITQSMKMVSAAKYARAERDLRPARPYGAGAQSFYQSVGVESEDAPKPSTLLIALTSDRGLCGAIHTSVGKRIKSIINESADPKTAKIVCLGDKSRGLLQRQHGSNILVVFSDFGKKPPLFQDAVKVANYVLQSGEQFEKGVIIYNRFKSVVSYQTSEIPIFSMEAINAAKNLPVYDSLDADVIQSYMEYSLASLLFYAMKENACSEQSSRMTAMDSASKNAGEMIDKLTMTFNRTRQAVITKELIEIISGAAAL